jgi:hypothetical protein
MGKISRRAFLKGTSALLAATAARPSKVFSSPHSQKNTNLRDLANSVEFPFGYNADVFGASERIFFEKHNTAFLNLFVKPGKALDIKVFVSDQESDLHTKIPLHLTGVKNSVDILLGDVLSPRLCYKVEYKDEKNWKSLQPRSVKTPNIELEKGDKLKVILKGDDHVYADLAHEPEDESWRRDVLRGDYISNMMQEIAIDPDYVPEFGTQKVVYGFALAHTLKYILDSGADLVIDLGDTVGTDSYRIWGGEGQWPELQPKNNLATQSRILWERKRRTISSLTPEIPFYQTLGNHDGEVNWFSDDQPFTQPYSRAQRKRMLRLPEPLRLFEKLRISSYDNADWFFPNRDQNYYPVFWGNGDIRFFILDVNSYLEGKPKEITDWTLGERQKELVMDMLFDGYGSAWKFICFHNTLGGYPLGSGKHPGAYGRGPLFTREDYEQINVIDPSLNIDPDRIQQVWLTETAQDADVRGFFYGHDHVFFEKPIGQTALGKDMIGACVGATIYSGGLFYEKIWSNPYWMEFYGPWYQEPPPFLTPPGITELEIDKDGVTIRYVCTAPPECMHANMPPGTKPGDVLREYRINR